MLPLFCFLPNRILPDQQLLLHLQLFRRVRLFVPIYQTDRIARYNGQHEMNRQGKQFLLRNIRAKRPILQALTIDLSKAGLEAAGGTCFAADAAELKKQLGF